MMMSTFVPRRFQRIIERVVAKDREYFAKHPEATQYTRPYVPGEAGTQNFPQHFVVTVMKHSDAYQFRLFHEPKDGAS
jgi:hypothetical protein